MRDQNGFLPFPTTDLLDFRHVARANPQNNLFRSYLIRSSPVEKSRIFAECPRADVIQRCDFLVQLFIAPYEHLGVIKSKLTNNFCEKGGLFQIRFHQKDPQIWPDNLERQAWKAASRPYVGEPTSPLLYGLGRVHALAKMTIKYLQRVAIGCQAYLLIPRQQNLYILLNLKDLVIISRNLEFRKGTADYGC